MLTCSLKGINMSTKKVLIIGAGPAGLATAIELKKRSKAINVVILEKNPKISYKVCAGGIGANPFKIGLSEDIISRRFDTIKVFTPNQKVIVERGRPIAATTNRKVLHEIMTKEAIELGVKILFGKSVKEINNNSVITSLGEKFDFDYLVGADGSNSMIRKSLGLKTKKILTAFQYMIPGEYPDMEFYLGFKEFGDSYFWVFPQKGIISVGTGRNNILCRESLTANDLRKNLKTWCEEKFDLKDAKFQSFPINYDYRGFEFRNGKVFLAGDAAGLASGLTGEGIKFAILSGRDIARKILDPNYECKEIKKILKIKKYGEGLNRFIARNKTVGKITVELLTFFLRTSVGKKLMKNLF